MKAKGRVFKYGDNIDTDVIIPARYLNTSDPGELAAHCMEDIDTEFVKNVKKGDIMVGTKNFGCGSSREHAPIAIKASGISCVIASSFARIFYRNAINIGLPIFECEAASLNARTRRKRSRTGMRSRWIFPRAISTISRPEKASRRSLFRNSFRTSLRPADSLRQSGRTSCEANAKNRIKKLRK